jgi:hypothetical protein
MFVNHLLLLVSKEVGSMQDSATITSVAMQYYLLWNEMKDSENTQ